MLKSVKERYKTPLCFLFSFFNFGNILYAIKPITIIIIQNQNLLIKPKTNNIRLITIAIIKTTAISFISIKNLYSIVL